jgi:uncharacterized protein (DUF433 family)
MGWKKQFGKNKRAENYILGATHLYYHLREHLNKGESVSMSASDLNRLLGKAWPPEARMIYFIPDTHFGEPRIDGEGRLGMNGYEFLKVLEKGVQPERFIGGFHCRPEDAPISLQ